MTKDCVSSPADLNAWVLILCCLCCHHCPCCLFFRPSSAAERNLVAKGLATVYDPSEDAEASAGCSSRAAETAGQEIEVVRPGGISAGNSTKLLQQGVPRAALDLSDMAAFLTRPGPKTGAQLCFIERDKGGMGQSPW